MIALLHGELHAKGNDWVIVQVGGIGFHVRVPASIVAELGEVGETVRLHTHLLVRDDAIALYGFATPEQLELFDLLLGVSGIGPKSALTLLSSTSPETLRLAIAREDVDVLTRVPGIGRKTASRLILELKGRIDLGRLGLPGGTPLAPEQAELVEVLASLGYTTAEARAAVGALSPEALELPLEERLRLALRYFGGA
jgi:Holliday junction DNA helicase RuvA